MNIARTIDAPAHILWDLLTDTQAWPVWGPTVAGAQCATRHIESGSQGTVKTAVGLSLPFEVTTFEPLYRWNWRVAGVHATGHRLVHLSEHQTRVIIEIPWIAAPYALVCKVALERLERMALERSSAPVVEARSADADRSGPRA